MSFDSPPPKSMDEFIGWPKKRVLQYYRDRGLEEAFVAIKKPLKFKYRDDSGNYYDADKGFREAQTMMPPTELGIEPVIPEVEEPEPEEPEEPDSDLTDEELDAIIADADPSNFERDFQWCSDNIARKNLKVEDAPSGAAWKYWKLFSNDNAGMKFLEISQKIHAARIKTSTDDDKLMSDDKRKQFALIEALQEPQTCPHCGKEIS